MWFCEVEIVHRKEVEVDLSDADTASCYGRQITSQVLSCIKFDVLKMCVPINMLWNAIAKDKGLYGSFCIVSHG